MAKKSGKKPLVIESGYYVICNQGNKTTAYIHGGEVIGTFKSEADGVAAVRKHMDDRGSYHPIRKIDMFGNIKKISYESYKYSLLIYPAPIKLSRQSS